MSRVIEKKQRQNREAMDCEPLGASLWSLARLQKWSHAIFNGSHFP